MSFKLKYPPFYVGQKLICIAQIPKGYIAKWYNDIDGEPDNGPKRNDEVTCIGFTNNNTEVLLKEFSCRHGEGYDVREFAPKEELKFPEMKMSYKEVIETEKEFISSN